MANKQPERQISIAFAVDLVLLDKLRQLGSMTKLQLMRRGLKPGMISLLEKRGILRANDSLGIAGSGVTEYTVVDDFLTKLTG